jgi:5-methylcytosine-specific restriction enzyme A
MPRLKTYRPSIRLADTSTVRRNHLLPDQASIGEFYGSPEWRALRRQVLREANGRCQWPGCGRSTGPMHVDHILEIKDGGAPLQRSNLWCLCQAHHNTKTAAEKAERSLG